VYFLGEGEIPERLDNLIARKYDFFYVYKGMKLLSILSFTTLLALGEQVPDTKQQLKFQFEAGKSYFYEQVMKSNSEMTNPATADKMEIEADMDMDFNFVAEKDPKGTKVDMTIDRFAMKQGSNGVTMIEIDTDDEEAENNPMAGMFTQLKDMELSAIYDEEGNLIEVKSSGSAPGMDQMGMGEDQFKQMFSQSHEILPNEPVGEGDTWEVEQEIPSGGGLPPLKVKMTCTLEAFEELDGHKCAKISCVGELDKGDGAVESPISITIEEFESETWHDLELNMTRKTISNIKMIIGASKGAEIGANGMGEIPTTVMIEQNLVDVK